MIVVVVEKAGQGDIEKKGCRRRKNKKDAAVTKTRRTPPSQKQEGHRCCKNKKDAAVAKTRRTPPLKKRKGKDCF